MKSQKSFETNDSTLYLVATPIGNLEDMTFRAINTLKTCDVIYAEDTRVSRTLLHHFDIDKPLRSYHDHNKMMMVEPIIEELKTGKNIALISDAGYPLVSDPGYVLVSRVLEAGLPVVSIPGANALLSALVVSGIAPHPFTFYGFLDHKEGKRKKELEALKHKSETLLFYESIHRIHKTMENMLSVFGNRQVVIARELTKRYEEIIRGTLAEMQELPPLKGELVIVVEGYQEQEVISTMTILEEITQYMDQGMSSKEAIKLVAKRRDMTKNDVYMEYHKNDETR